MTDPELQAIIRGLVPAVRELVTAALTPVVARLASIEAVPPARDGRDGLAGPPGPPGRDGVDGAAGVAGADGKDGTDGIGVDALSVDYDGERTLALTIRGTERTVTAAVVLPIPLYRGVWSRTAAYTRGDTVTFGGSLWHANQEPADAKPGDGSPCWTLAVKRGQDAR